MIVSHKHKFIFIKTVKTAGTSLEIALSKYCGSEDVISPILPEDEKKRLELGFRGPQNYKIPFAEYSIPDVFRSVRARKPLTFFNHARATFVRSHVAPEIWDSYFKFCFERNPWDKFVSWYYWNYKTEPRPPLTEIIQTHKPEMVREKGWGLYNDSSGIIVDRVFTFEQLGEALIEISERLELDEIPVLPRTKANHRTDRRNYRDILSTEDGERIAKVFKDEIDLFGYQW